MEKMTKADKAAHAAYMRNYRAKNKEKMHDYYVKRWRREAEKSQFIDTAVSDMTDDTNEGD